VLRAALLLVVAMLASACDPNVTPPAATPTATLTAPTPIAPTTASVQLATPTVAPPKNPAASVRAWDVPPPSGVPHLDAIVAAMVTANRKALEAYLEAGTRTEPCTTIVNSGDLICPAGVVTGTPVRFIETAGGCEGIRLRIDPPGSQPDPTGTTIERLAERIAGHPRFLWMAIKSSGPDSYELYFLDTRGGGTSEEGWSFSVNATGITSFGSAKPCGLSAQSQIPEMIRQQTGSTFLVPPP
jgi:hypothetical protein